MADDYYLVLGITRDAGMTQIRRAYRRLSYRFHPEVVGDEGLDQYRRIREAYETLIHPSRRSDHDRTLQEAERRRGGARPGDEPLMAEPIDVVRDFGTVRPGRRSVSTVSPPLKR